MFISIQRFHRSAVRIGCLAGAWLCALHILGCSSHTSPRIAIIPQTEGMSIWDAVHVGAESQAQRSALTVYWNAPTREDDVDGQIALVDHVTHDRYQGLILAPSQSLALISPVRRALERGIPTAIISSPLPLPHSANLINIVNDDELGGHLAAQRVVAMLNGHGTVALLGINPDITGIMTRAHTFELELTRVAPGIEIVERHAGTFNALHEQQVAEDTLRAHPGLDVIIALTWDTADGAYRAIESNANAHATRIVAFDCIGIPAFDQWKRLDSIIQQNTRAMGQKAVEALNTRMRGGAMPADMLVPPRLITRDNISNADVREMFSADLELWNWRWSLFK
ncbi:MAG TPA: substrate-binding domain-containing protein [Terracidiphilus sp.]|nr:substrate-binding domain-containing protein [Terracidiphilus sp.]